MSLGIFDFLINWIANLIGDLLGWVFSIIMGIYNRMIFSVAKSLLIIVDLIQVLFRRLSGTDVYYVNVGTGHNKKMEGDILGSLITNETVLEVLLALTLVAIAMVIMATIIKIVQSEFNSDGKNSKTGIIAEALRSFIMFILVPVTCVGGVLVSNALLGALDQATSLGGGKSMASQVFVSAASAANKVRYGQMLSIDKEWLKNQGMWVEGNTAQTAVNIDNAFRMQRSFEKAPVSAGGIVDTILNAIFSAATAGPYGWLPLVLNVVLSNAGLAGGISSGSGDLYDVQLVKWQASYQNIYMVASFYDIGQMNMIILIGGAIMACYIMLVTCFGLVMRLFKAVILFMISPPVIAIAPLDKGNAFQSWRRQFISEVLSSYGAVLGLNLFFIVLPVLNNIDLFPASYAGTYGGNILNDIAHLLFTIIGLYMMKDLIKMVSDLTGGSDATGAGEKMAKQAGQAALQVGMLAAGVATGGAGFALKGAASLGAKMAGNKATKLANKKTGLNAEVADLRKQETAARESGNTKLAEKLGKKANKKQNQANNISDKEIEEQRSKHQARQERAENFAKKIEKNRVLSPRGSAGAIKEGLAYSLGSMGELLGNLGLDVSTKKTVAERNEDRDNRAAAAVKRIEAGEGTFLDYLSPTRQAYSKRMLAENQEAQQVLEQTETAKQGVRNNAQTTVEKINNMLSGNNVSKADITAQTIQLEGEINSGMYAEDEQTQQILRSMLQQLKDMSKMDQESLNAALGAMVKGDDGKRQIGGTTLLAKNKVESEATVKILQEMKGSGKEITPELLKKTVEKVLEQANFKDQGLDAEKLRRTVAAALKDILDKRSQ